jgi:hypothetical protein
VARASRKPTPVTVTSRTGAARVPLILSNVRRRVSTKPSAGGAHVLIPSALDCRRDTALQFGTNSKVQLSLSRKNSFAWGRVSGGLCQPPALPPPIGTTHRIQLLAHVADVELLSSPRTRAFYRFKSQVQKSGTG